MMQPTDHRLRDDDAIDIQEVPGDQTLYEVFLGRLMGMKTVSGV